MRCSNSLRAVVLTLLFGLSTWQNSQAENGAFYYAPYNWLFIYTGNSGHDVEVGVVDGFEWVVVLIDSEVYPVYSSGSTLLVAGDVTDITVDTGNGADTVDLSAVNDTDFDLNYIDVYTEGDDDFVDGPTTEADVLVDAGAGTGDVVIENGSGYTVVGVP